MKYCLDLKSIILFTSGREMCSWSSADIASRERGHLKGQYSTAALPPRGVYLHALDLFLIIAIWVFASRIVLDILGRGGGREKAGSCQRETRSFVELTPSVWLQYWPNFHTTVKKEAHKSHLKIDPTLEMWNSKSDTTSHMSLRYVTSAKASHNSPYLALFFLCLSSLSSITCYTQSHLAHATPVTQHLWHHYRSSKPPQNTDTPIIPTLHLFSLL